MRDLDIKIAPWRQDPSEKRALVRTLEFRHPVSKSLGIGPSHTPTKKQQRLQRFPGLGLCLTNSTTVEGVPSSDCFAVMDHWLVEVDNSGGGPSRVTLSAKFGTNFTKRTFLKSIIQKDVRSATKEWFSGYKSVVQAATMEQPAIGATQAPASIPTTFDGASFDNKQVDGSTLQVSATSRMFLLLVVSAQIVLLLCLLLVLRELRASQQTSEILLEEMKHLRMEHGQVLDLLLANQREGYHASTS